MNISKGDLSMSIAEEVAIDFIEDMIKGKTQKEIEERNYIYRKGLIKHDPNLQVLEQYLLTNGYKLIRISNPNEFEEFKFKIKKL